MVSLKRILLGLCLCLSSLSVHAIIDQVAWEATRVVRVDGREVITRVNHTPLKERITAMLGGVEVTLIMRSDKKLLWQLLPIMSMAGETDISQMDTPADIKVLSRVRIGEEAVGGQNAVRYRVSYLARDDAVQEGEIWENAAGVHLRSRFTVVDHTGAARVVELELRDLKVGPQADALFEVPAEYSTVKLDARALLGSLLGL